MPASVRGEAPAGEFTTLEGRACYRIADYDRMAPFFMSLPSDTDLWMFLTSRGGLTAGRVDPDGALFPYETVDRLHDSPAHTGPITLVRVARGGGQGVVWEPFAESHSDGRARTRNLYKSALGNQVVFEEIHHGLGLAFRYRWAACDAFGHVRTATLENLGPSAVTVSVLDGLRNLLPFGAPLALYQQSSVLVDAYKRADCDPATGLATYSLTSRIVDRPEAAEVLRANVAWRAGAGPFAVALGADAAERFRRGETIAPERVRTGERGSYLAAATFDLPRGAARRWHMAVDAGRSHVDVAALGARLRAPRDLEAEIERRLSEADESLRALVAGADGLQLGGRRVRDAHHFANVLYNCMRGGVFAHDHRVPVADFADFLHLRNRATAGRRRAALASLGAEVDATALREAAARTGDADFERLALEYLPLWFGRRHGDPSRPWNRFAIRVRRADGRRALRYEGNWRDIFQNWDALAWSFPGFLTNLVAAFVNASTVDGFNPYRVGREGIDWEAPDPSHPWAHIGYWGDHQVAYLLPLLESLERFSPGALDDLLARDVFAYADVPYRIRPYAALRANPRVTIEYDAARADRIAGRVRSLGADGRLVPGPGGDVLHVNLFEKLLVPALSKLSNYVPEGGVWMNTQRPEWNDANNALVGDGLSVVTLCHLAPYLEFCARLFARQGDAAFPVSNEVVAWCRRLHAVLADRPPRPEGPALDDAGRGRMLDALGEAFSDYRAAVYARGFSGRTELTAREARAFLETALAHVDHGIRANRRPDGLYHAYNLLAPAPTGRGVALHRLPEMLEGQVAAMASGRVGAAEAGRLVARLFASPLYRADQRSFLLYPEKTLPAFREKNRIPPARVAGTSLLAGLLEAGDTSLVAQDAEGGYRFHADFQNAADVARALDRLARAGAWTEAVARDRSRVLEAFEEVFHHRDFTGRSGAMYAYEGLGSVYWHMVAKLLLAVQGVLLRALRDGAEDGADVEAARALTRAYFRIRRGLGCEKTPIEFGAFPFEPYSHTPRNGGAQQPGMTGQVKEEILTRLGELGVRVEGGTVRFEPRLLTRDDFRRAPGELVSGDAAGGRHVVAVPAGSLAFTFCRVPIVYALTRGESALRMVDARGAEARCAGVALDRERSRALFARADGIAHIEASIPESWLVAGADAADD